MMIKRQKVQNCLCLFLLRNTVYLKEGHHNHTSPAIQQPVTVAVSEFWRRSNGETLKILVSFSLMISQEANNPPSEFARPRESGPAWLLYQLGPSRLHYCAVLLTVLERWVAPCLLLSLSAFCILGNNTLQTLEFSKHPYRKRVHL